MTKFSMFKNYKDKINEIFIPGYENIKWGNVLYSRIWNIESIKNIDVLKQLIKTLFVKRTEIKKSYMYKDILIFTSFTNRKDYNDILLKIRNLLLNEHNFIEEILSRKIKLNVIKQLIYITQVYYNIKNIDINRKLYFTLLICQNIEFYQYLKKEIDLDKLRYVITFCDHFERDNLITQIAKLKGIKTITLQHGQYVYQKNNTNAGCLSYENFISDYMLVWGQATIYEFKKYGVNENRLIKVGCPKFINNENIKVGRIENGKIGLLLNNENHSQSNISMIKIACNISKVLNKKLIVKPHPQNNMNNYLKYFDKDCIDVVLDKNNSISDYAKMVEFSILHTSSTFVELNCMTSPVFRYKDENYISMYDCDKDEFSSLDEFINKYSLLKEDYESWKSYMKQIEEYFVCGVEGTTERYRNILINYIKE